MIKTSREEQLIAQQVSAAVDQLLLDPESAVELPHTGAAEAVVAARQVARLTAQLGPVDEALEETLMRQVRRAGMASKGAIGRRLGWAVAGLIVVLFAVVVLTPQGQSAVAGLMAAIDLGRTDVHVLPQDVPSVVQGTAVDGGRAIRQSLPLDEARASVSFAIPQPGYLPPGFRLEAVYGYQYPDLPAWVPQPFFIELIYNGNEDEELLLRVYSITLGDEASVSSLNLRAPPIEYAEDVEVNGQPGVLLRQALDRSGAESLELVWEQDDLILALSSQHVDELDLLNIARSIRGSAPGP